MTYISTTAMHVAHVPNLVMQLQWHDGNGMASCSVVVVACGVIPAAAAAARVSFAVAILPTTLHLHGVVIENTE